MAATATSPAQARTPAQERRARSLACAMFAGDLRRDWLFPSPRPDEAETARVDELRGTLRAYLDEAVDPRRIEERRWIGDDVVRELGDRGLMGLGVPRRYGGAGLSRTGYCRMFEELGNFDAGFALIVGIHQAIGTLGIVEFGSDEQKERFLPDLASGRKLAAFALTEPLAGSDAYNIGSRAVRQPDGSWRLNGSKCFIGNGEKASVFVTFARAEVDGKDRHVALILEKGMPGFEHGERYDSLGLKANDVRPLYFDDVRVPPENVLGEPGQGFRIARSILERGRVTIGAANAGCARRLLDLTVEHVCSRRQFGRALGDFPMIQEKLAWMATGLLATEAMTYLTTGFEDAGRLDCSLEIALCKIWSTEYVVGAANRALDLRGGAGYMTSEPYERILRDVRVFPIFEGSNDVLRGWIALSAITALVERLGAGGENGLVDGGACHPELSAPVARLEDQVGRLGEGARALLTARGEEVRERQLDQGRIADALIGCYMQAAVLSRLDSRMREDGPDEPAVAGERVLAADLCRRSAERVERLLVGLDDDRQERVAEVAALVCGGT